MFDYGVGILEFSQTKGRLFQKKKDVMYLLSYTKGMSKFIITVKNKSRISLVKLVVLRFPLFLATREINFVKLLLSESRYFWHLPVKFNSIATFGEGCYFENCTVG